MPQPVCFFKISFNLITPLCVCGGYVLCKCTHAQSLGKGSGVPGAGATGACKPPSAGPGNQLDPQQEQCMLITTKAIAQPLELLSHP